MLLDDAMLLEAVGRQGGYEEVEKSLGAWNAIAKALGQRKTDGESLKYRYEEMMMATAQAQEQEEEDEALERSIGRDYEVEDIVGDRIEDGGKQYHVKWKDCEEFEDASTWEPIENLAGSHELIRRYEARKEAAHAADVEVAAAAAATTVVALGNGEGGSEPDGAGGADGAGAGASAPAAAVEGGEDGGGGAAGCSGAAGGGGSRKRQQLRPADQWIKVERVRPKTAAPGSELCWLVSCTPPAMQQLVPNLRMRREAPQLLLDFYEARLRYPSH